MKKIVLLCTAGMSTSMLVTKMRQAAQEDGVDVQIDAYALVEANDRMKEADILLLSPQVKYQKTLFEEKVAGRIPVEVIDMRDYGTMNGKKVLEMALAKMGDTVC